MVDVVLEVTRAVVLAGLIFYLWRLGRRSDFVSTEGWNLILAGFILLLAGTLLDITDNYDSLNRFVVIGDTETEAFLEKVVGYLGGFIVLAIGLVRWAPSMEKLAKEVHLRKEAEEELRTLNADLEARIDQRTEALVEQTRILKQSNDDLEKFAYVASHDLQEPLRTIINYLQLLERKLEMTLGGDDKEAFLYVVTAAKRMRQLIRDLLAYSRVESQGKAFTRLEMSDLAASVVSELKSVIEETGSTVSTNNLPTVEGDSGQIFALLQNLIANGIMYRHPDRPAEITLSAEREGDSWHFEVTDNGIGIEAPYQERIFVIFQRLHNMEDYEGTGIGLAVSKRIVERHNGRIWVTSTPGEGSTFHFTLPARLSS